MNPESDLEIMTGMDFRSEQLKQIFALAQENFYTEHPYLSQEELAHQWRAEANRIAQRWGLLSIPQGYENRSTAPKPSQSMTRSQTYQPVSTKQVPMLQRTHSVFMGPDTSMSRSDTNPQSTYRRASTPSTQEISSAPPLKRQRTNTGSRRLMPAVLEHPTIEEYSPTQYLNDTAPNALSSNAVGQIPPLSIMPDYTSYMFTDQSLIDYSFGTLTPDDSRGPSPVFSASMSRQSSGITSSVTSALDMLRIKSEQGGTQHLQDVRSYSSSCPNSLEYFNQSPYPLTQCNVPQSSFSDNELPYTANLEHAFEEERKFSIKQEDRLPTISMSVRQETIRLAPKANSGSAQDSVPSHTYPTTISVNGKEKYSISRSTIPRQQIKKLYCNQCNEHPEGYRGDHELRRHVERAHPKSTRKVWVCVDASEDKTFLANCKYCSAQKPYNAYYNAAAHLRRVHFNPKRPGPKIKGVALRAGKGGGDQPPMDHLKTHWIREIDVPIDETSTSTLDEEADDSIDEDSTNTYSFSSSEDMSVSNEHVLFGEDLSIPRFESFKVDDSFSFYPLSSSFSLANNNIDTCTATVQDSLLFL